MLFTPTESLPVRVVKSNLPLSGSVLQSHKLGIRMQEFSQEPTDYASSGVDQDNVYPTLHHSSNQVRSDYYSRQVNPTASHQV